MTAPSELRFTKMNGAGNDFIMIDGREQPIPHNESWIARLCDRHRGIGADGLIILQEKDGLPRMLYFNSDGGRASMCGNGARCFVRYAQRQRAADENFDFITDAGVLRGHIDVPSQRVTVEMSEPHSWKNGLSVAQGDRQWPVLSVNTGVPHAVVQVDDIEDFDLHTFGAWLRHHAVFQPNGTNVNIFEELSAGKIRVRTFERGVEAETLACGTGVVASCLAYAFLKDLLTEQASEHSVVARVQSGEDLKVSFSGDNAGHFENVKLMGPAEFVFEGTLEANHLT
ncbi:MAG: diaminopimelate epimerase [Verrucomicrobiales bacterium]